MLITSTVVVKTEIAMNALNTTPITRASHLSDGQLLFGPSVEVPAAVAGLVSVDDVCDLIEAAGPLTLCDIAGGLDVPARRVVARIRRLVAARLLKRDEFGRYRLMGASA
jgi:hypothetical protein